MSQWGNPSCHYGKPCEDLKFLGVILKKYVEIPEVN